ncbi:MAG: DUF5107 domain-containing protein [Beutenbergiaceae bacterium]
MPTVTVSTSTLTVRGSALGPPCPLPSFAPMRALPPIQPRIDDAAMAQRMQDGRLGSPLPYPRHSDYDRQVQDLELPAITLSNGTLTATVLPTLGGRVWQLFDHTRERELLFVNPTLQFANFGLTDAWFAGGIEWNLGSTGHWTHSSRDVWAAHIHTPWGAGVRLWEWERTRDLILQVDLSLDADQLLASTRVINPDPEPKPLYYWTNIAVPQTTGTRVICEASHAWRTDYAGFLDRVPVPHPDQHDVDISYPASARNSSDYFFDTSGQFIASVEPDGRGLLQAATEGLHGRKLFQWGNSTGGQHWQQWLCDSGRYVEIQAGWCATQLEHDTLGGHDQVSWTESFSALELDPASISGQYQQACGAVREQLTQQQTLHHLQRRHQAWLAEVADVAPGRTLHTGSGWGAAELALRGGSATVPAAVPCARVADESEGALAIAQADTAGFGQAQHPVVPPVSPRWQQALAAQIWDNEPWVRYARGVAAHLRSDLVSADAEYRCAVDLATPTSPAPIGAWRGIALLAAQRGDPDAADLYDQALATDPTNRVLLTEACQHLLPQHPQRVLDTVAAAPPAAAGHGRIRLMRARALHLLGEHEQAIQVLQNLSVADLAEGGRDITELWDQLCPGQALPAQLDFRMRMSATD